ncbi:hypothetical protein Barb6XT_02075 [Bacteroidales bacterium Barb6XT]|nr:hypothetical protein Barb6XT_02075 [Bacteroidales bacterium Barb6XT]
MKQENFNQQKKSGRKPKLDPATIRYSVSFNEVEHAQFLTLFERTRMSVKAHFIKVCIFDKPIKVITIDKTMSDYVRKLTEFHSQIRAIGQNYNQVVKALRANFSEQKAMTYLYKLEKVTKQLSEVYSKVLVLTERFEEQWLPK